MTHHGPTTAAPSAAGPSGADPRPIGQRLKEDCWDLHQLAEHGDIPRRMATGTIDRPTYARLLAHSLPAHRALDRAIAAHRHEVPLLHELVDDAQLMAPRIEDDLRELGLDPAAQPSSPAASALIGRIDSARRHNPIELFGLHYVREGANNGNRFIAARLRAAWGIPQSSPGGLRSLDPYGESQRPRWAAFKARLDALDPTLSEAQKHSIVAAARDMFTAITELHRELETAQ